MWKRLTAALLPLVLLLILPFLFRPGDPGRDAAVSGGTDTLVIVSSHTEQLRYEFDRAFRRYYRKNFGRDIVIDWRNVGGTSDIIRYAQDRFEAQFRKEYEKSGGVWTDAAAARFKDPKQDPGTCPERKRFLESDVGIGIDVFFGGGSFEHGNFARIGFAVPAGVESRHPEWFTPEIMPERFAGEQIRDPLGRYYGVCLSSFGIAANPDRFREQWLPLPRHWSDLAAPELFRRIEIADPTKSGSVMKCYEMILQQEMSRTSPEQGWIDGFLLIRRIAANSRCITDSAGKLVRDVSSGAAAASICIDYYGFSEADLSKRLSRGETRLVYRMPENGSAVTADSVLMFRGAPNRKQAEAFLDFLLSPEGQALWMRKPGTPGGPERYPLLRPCVRKDLYSSIPETDRSIPGYDPYHAGGTFRYHGEWTGRWFSLIRVLIKSMMLDPHDELVEVWSLILENGGPSAQPEAMAILAEMPFPLSGAAQAAARLSGTPAEAAAVRREWTEFASSQYRRAARAVRKGEPVK